MNIVSPSSSLRSPGNSTDSASEAREVRLDEAPEAKLAGLLPGSLLIQWSHRDELVEPMLKKIKYSVSINFKSHNKAYCVVFLCK